MPTLNPQHLAFFNLGISVFLIICLILFKYFFPRKKINLIFLLLAVSTLPILSIFRHGTYESGLLTEDVQIFISFFDTLKDGNLFPVWAHNAFVGYGNPAHLFMYPLPFYIASLFHLASLTFLDSIKAVLAFSFIFSGISMYYWIKTKFGEIPGFMAGLFYLFTPYHLSEMHFRASAGVTLSFVFMPLVILFLEQTITTKKIKYLLPGGLFLGLLMLSHPATFLVFCLFIFPYSLFLIWKNKVIMNLIYVSLFYLYGMAISAFYWIPLITESYLIKHVSNLQTNDFKALWEYIYSPTLFGLLFQGHHGETHFLIGYPHLFAVIAIILLLIRKKIKKELKSELVFLIIIFIFLFLLMLPISSQLWEFPFLKLVPNPWRVLAIISVITSVLGGYFTYLLLNGRNISRNRFLITLICLFVIFSTILNWGNRKTVLLNYDSIKKSFTQLPDSNDNRTWTIWVKNDSKWKNIPERNNIDLIEGNAKIREIFRDSTKHTYLIDVYQSSTIRENTMFFPGWNLKVNNKNYFFSYTEKNYEGLMVFNLNPGLYKVDLVLQNSKIREISQKISIASIVVLLIFIVIRAFPNFRRKYA